MTACQAQSPAQLKPVPSGISRELKVGLTVFGAMFMFPPKDIQGGFYGLGQMGTIRRIEQNSKSHQ
jgi:hypothetical protein